MAVVITWTCKLCDGVHARPAGYIARLCNQFHAAINWENTRTGLLANAKSPLSLIASDTQLHDKCRITLHGKDELMASEQLHSLLVNFPASNYESISLPLQSNLPRCLRELNPRAIQGICINKGVAIAKLDVMQGLDFDGIITRNQGQFSSLENEKKQFLSVLQSLRNEVEASDRQDLDIEHELTAAYHLLMTDLTLQENVIGHINSGMNAWSAITQASLDFYNVLRGSSSPYIQERSLDVLDIASQLISAIYGEESLSHYRPKLNGPTIVCADHLTPGQFLALDRDLLCGIALSSTSIMSHTAILARSRGIPILVGVDISMLALKEGQQGVIDSERGVVILDPDEKILRYYRHEINVQKQMRRLLLKNLPRVEVNDNFTSTQGGFTYSMATKPLLSPEMILWEIDAADKNEAIKMMVDNLWLHQRTYARDNLCEEIWARELPFSTVVGSGFAIPHARTDYIRNSTISVARLMHPIAWGEAMVDTLFMLTISKSTQNNEHMKYFSMLARMLMNDGFTKQIKAVETPSALYNLICKTLAL